MADYASRMRAARTVKRAGCNLFLTSHAHNRVTQHMSVGSSWRGRRAEIGRGGGWDCRVIIIRNVCGSGFGFWGRDGGASTGIWVWVG